MPVTPEFLNALFYSTEGDIVVETSNGEIIETSDAAFLTATPDLRIRPLTSAGVSFLYELTTADKADAPAAATAILTKGDHALRIWRLTEPAALTDVPQALLDALGIESFEEAIPMPGTNGWESVYIDSNVEIALATLCDAFIVPEPSGTYGDAEVMRRFDETEPQYHKLITVTLGANKEAKNWKPQEMPVGALLAKLSQHKPGRKDGAAFVLADMVPGRRTKTSVKKIHGIGLDIDVGTPSSLVDAAIGKLGCAAVRYTTHSHLKTREEFKKDAITKYAPDEEITTELMQRYLREIEQWDSRTIDSVEYIGIDHTDRGIVACIEFDPMPKNRIIVPIDPPYEIAHEGKTQQEAMARWAKVPTALAAEMGLHLDKSCLDPSRLFYFPRHKEGKSFEVRLWGGPLLDWHTLEVDSPFDNIPESLTKSTSKSKTPEGQALGRWSVKRAHGFQIRDVIEQFAPDRIRGSASSRGITIECPFDDLHSNAGDQGDVACFAVNAGEGQSEIFTISCRHDSCHAFTNLDMLGHMMKEGWFDESVLEDQNFNAILDEETTPPEAQKLHKEDTAKASYDDAIEALNPDSSEEEMDAAFQLIVEAKLTGLKLGAVLNKVKKKLGCPIADVRRRHRLIQREIEKIREEDEPEHAKNLDPRGRRIFRYDNEYHFDEAWMACEKALIRANETAGLPLYCHIGDQPHRLSTNKRTKRISFDSMDATAFWAQLNNLVTFVRKMEQADGPRAQVPIEVAKQVHAQTYNTLPAAPEVIYTPVFVADGRLISEPGYYFDKDDPDFNILLADTGFRVEPVPMSPTVEEMQESLEWIKLEIFSDFPFLDFDRDGNERRAPSEANALAMLLTPFMRRMINGCTPVFGIVKPSPGTGGTLLGKVPILTFDGIDTPPIRYSQNEEEMNKSLVAALMETKSHLFFDDVKEFNSRELLRAITSRYIGGRILGSSRNVEHLNNFNWIMTANNPFVGNEMERRVVWIRMNLKQADVQGRKFRHPLEEFIKLNRETVVFHVLRLIQFWISVGMPMFTERSRASFEDWGRKVGGVLQVCGVEGFLDNKREAGQDIHEAANKAFIKEVIRKFGAETYATPGDLYKHALDTELDILEGANEDIKKARFMKTLPSLNERTFTLDGTDYMLRSTLDDDMNVVYFVKKIMDAV